MTPHRGPSRQRHCRDGPAAAAVRPPSGAFPLPCAAPVRLPSDVPPGDRLAGADGARVVAPRPHRPVPARKGPRSWCRSCSMIALLPLDLPTTLLTLCLGAIRRQMRVWSGQAPPSTISTPPVLPAGIPDISPTSLSVSPHGTFLRRLGTRATWHAQCRLVCDGLSFPWLPPLSDGAAAPPRPRGRAGAATTEGDRGGTTAGTTGIASGFLTRINEGHSPKEAPL